MSGIELESVREDLLPHQVEGRVRVGRGSPLHDCGNLDTWLVGAGIFFHVPKVPVLLFVGGTSEIEDGKHEAFLRVSGSTSST